MNPPARFCLQGYSVLSGLPGLLASYVQNCTWEGDNSVMALQMARHLVKAMAAAQQGTRVDGQCAYYARHAGPHGAAPPAAPPASTAALLHALERAAAALCTRALALLDRSPAGGPVTEGPAWDANTTVLIDAAYAHSRVVLAATFEAAVQRIAVPEATRAVLAQLSQLFAAALVGAHAAPVLLETGYAETVPGLDSGAGAGAGGGRGAAFMGALRAARAALEAALRRDAVRLVDAFGHDDYLLNSAIGRQDGDVYRALFDAAQGSPLNETEEGPAWGPVLSKHIVNGKPRAKL